MQPLWGGLRAIAFGGISVHDVGVGVGRRSGQSELPRQLKGAWRRARKQKLRKRGRVKRAKMQRCKDLPQGEGLKPICQRRFFCLSKT